MNQPWYERVCINCGGGPTNAPCDDHWYSHDERRDCLIEELLDRVEALEERKYNKRPREQEKSKPVVNYKNQAESEEIKWKPS